MRLLVDTSVLVDHLRGDPRAVGVLVDAAGAGDELWSVTVVRTEVHLPWPLLLVNRWRNG